LGRRAGDRVLLLANAVVSALLITWGAVNVLAGALVLAGAISPAAGLDERALRWHVFVWDMWFLIWGTALALALVGFRHTSGPCSRLR
jgi:hypothetical protein